MPSISSQSNIPKSIGLIFTLVALIILSTILSYQQGQKQGLIDGSLAGWNKPAAQKTAQVDKLLSHYSYGYRLQGTLVKLDGNEVVVTKGSTTKSFSTQGVNFILGNPNLPLEDNLYLSARYNSQILGFTERSKIFLPGDSIILVSRAFHKGDPIRLTQLIKMSDQSASQSSKLK